MSWVDLIYSIRVFLYTTLLSPVSFVVYCFDRFPLLLVFLLVSVFSFILFLIKRLIN